MDKNIFWVLNKWTLDDGVDIDLLIGAIKYLIGKAQYGHALNQVQQKQVDAMLLLAESLDLSING